MDANAPVAGLAERLQGGGPDAAEAVFGQYAERLIRLATQKLGRKVVGRVDGEDVVQSVFRTFFRRHAKGEFRIDSSGELWQLLVKITVRKAHAKVRYHTRPKRAVGAESPIDEAVLAQALAREPQPEEMTMLAEEIEALVKGFPKLHGNALAMRLQGYAVPEIATALNVSRRSVERALKLLRDRLTRTTTV